MVKFRLKRFTALAALLSGGALLTAIACGSEAASTPQIVIQTVVVKETVAPVVQTVVVKETSAPVVQTVVVKETQIVQQTVVSTVLSTVNVVVTATASPIPTVAGIVGVNAPDPKTPVGTAIFVTDADILDQNGRNESQSPEFIHYWGMGETMFLRGPNDEALPWLASAWKLDLAVAPSTKHVATLTLQKGVKFQTVPGKVNTSGNWGEITADDVVWSMNDTNAITNPKSIHGQAGDFKIWGEWKKVDDYTVTFTFNAFDGTWKDDYLSQSGQSFVPFSKKAFDQEGATWVRDNVVATGPFQVEAWTRSDKLTMKSRYAGADKHWKAELTPKTARIQIIYAPDSTTRVAMMKTGEADVTNLAPKDVPQFVKNAGQFGTTTTNGTMQMGIFFGGNLWELTSAVDGTPLTRGTYNVDFATIGNPTSTTDTADMEEAKTIRTALAMAYDRDAINKALLAGLGHAAHVEYVSIKNPRYQIDPSKGFETAPGVTNVANLKWGYKYDVAAARELIKGSKVQGNYDKGSASKTGPLGDRSFELSLYSQQPSEIRAEVQDAIVGYWTELGLKVFALKFSYQTFRPSVVGRTSVYPWVTECDKGNEGNPWHFPKGLVQTSLTRGGFGCGFEIPFVLDNYRKVANEPDTAKANALVDEYITYMYDQALQPGIVSSPNLNVFNLKKIKSWPMASSATSGQDSFWNLELQAGK